MKHYMLNIFSKGIIDIFIQFVYSQVIFIDVTQMILFLEQRLKQICDLPVLLTQKAAENVLEGMSSMLSQHDVAVMEEMVSNVTYRQGLKFSTCKMNFILPLLVSVSYPGDGS